MRPLEYLKSVNADYVEELLEKYLEDPDSVDESWKYFFEGLEIGQELGNGGFASQSSESAPDDRQLSTNAPDGVERRKNFDLSSEAKVAELITAYRERGRLISDLDPLSHPPTSHPLLELSNFRLSEKDLDRTFTAGKLMGMGPATLRDILAKLKRTYCSKIAVEFTHIHDFKMREWIASRMESCDNRENLDPETKKSILKRLTWSETFESFLHTRYVAQKRFSLEGGEALIPTLDRIIEVAADLGAHNIVMGMAHRGRLNVLYNTFGKKAEFILTEFEDAYQMESSSSAGDVKYHMGYSSDTKTASGKDVHLALAYNPSHLEFVNPVVEGMARAKQRRYNDTDRSQVIPILIHGDAAFSGQGVVYETLNFSQTEGYSVGGTIHIVLDNQIGFTTDPENSRSTTYATDMAKMLQVPIFHVNGDDPEALWYVARLCTEFRQTFKKDIFIDLICYRKYGHNEGDEPSFTQPLMVKNIKSHATPRKIYGEKLRNEGVISEADEKAFVDEHIALLTEAQKITRQEKPRPFISAYENRWKGLKSASEVDIFKGFDTSFKKEELLSLGKKLYTVPEGFNIHPKLKRLVDGRLKAVHDGVGIDWGNAETLAYASLLTEGHPIRISGQDVERGTFSHRQCVLNDFQNGNRHTALNHLSPDQAEFMVFNSTLSETAVLGFDYGWSLADPNALVIWEAQFGDFSNGAQVIIDQFIASSEVKWNRASGIVLLLPHGYEGQGPEHSSARLERFLQLCANNNMAVCNLTTPAQVYHAFRRQMKRDFRKPLVIMSPKSLLRHPKAVSTLEELSQKEFWHAMDDPKFKSADKSKVERILLCSGKVYYDLEAARNECEKKDKIAIIRIEQLYPWASGCIKGTLDTYPKDAEIVWVQEEPRNMGAWSYVFNLWSGGSDTFSEKVGNRAIRYVGRELSATPAVGSHKRHAKEQKALVEDAIR